MRYYKKELCHKPFLLANGKFLTFTSVFDQTGLIATDDEALIAQLSQAVGSAGLSEITEAKFEEYKKKLPSPMRETPSAKPRLFAPPADPFAGKEPLKPEPPKMAPTITFAKPVTEQASVQPVAEASPAVPVVAPVASDTKPAFKPRTQRMPRRGSSKD